MSTVMITGGTGLIGSALSSMLVESGYNVIILSRNPLETAKANRYQQTAHAFRSNGNLFYSRWDIEKKYIDPAALKEADHIIHLAGASVAAKRWTATTKREILESRTKSGELLVEVLKNTQNKVKTIVSASAIGWYGPDKGTPFVEEDPFSNDFLGQTCEKWESSILPLEELGKRLVRFRIGIVLSNEGGALKEFRKPLRFGVAAVMGNGSQMVSWVHIQDLCRAYMMAIENSSLSGVFNLVAPNPVSNRELTITLAEQIAGGRYIPFKVPSTLLKLILGEMSVEVLKSATVSSKKLSQEGFQFMFPTINSAIQDLYS
ncbi:MAG: TIGR01777 family oxidoreductase [Chitinophagaceae bacterium]